MFNKIKNLKNRLISSKSWGEFFASCFVDLDKLNKELEGQTETKQIQILKKALEDQTKKTGNLVEVITKQNEQIEELTNENQKLKEQIKDSEEVESILSGSGSSDGSINSQRRKERERLLNEIRTSKKSTAPQRKMLKYLDDIEKLEQQNREKDERIKRLEKQSNKQKDLNKIKGMLDFANQKLDNLGGQIREVHSSFEIKPK